MTKEEKLLYAIGEIDDDLIVAADDSVHKVVPFPVKTPWKKIAMTAACFLLIAGVWFSVSDLFRMGSMAPAEAPQALAPAAPAEAPTETAPESVEMTDVAEPEESPAETPSAAPPINDPMEDQKHHAQTGSKPFNGGIDGAEPEEANPTTGGVGGTGAMDGEYNVYYLPVQSLNISGETADLSVAREVTVDTRDYTFSDAKETVTIYDNYCLMNSSSKPVSVNVEYLYGESLQEPNEVAMTVDGSAEGQTVGVTSTIPMENGESIVFNYQTFRKYCEEKRYNLPCIQVVDTVNVYRIHSVCAGDYQRNRSAVVVEFTAPKNTPVLLENLNGVMTAEGENYRYEVSGSMNFDEWSIIVCGDPVSDFDVSFVDRSGNEEVFLKAEYQLETLEKTLRTVLNGAIQEYLEEQTLGKYKLSMDVMVAAVTDTFYDCYGFRGRAAVPVLQELVTDSFHGKRYLSLEQTITIPANGSVTVEVQTEKLLNQWFESEARGLELLNDGNVPTTVTFLPPKMGGEVSGNLPENGALDPMVECYSIVMEPALCGLPTAN